MPDFLIIRLSSLGDIIHTLPSFAALRKTHPKSKIRWVVEPKGKDILDLVEGLDEIIVRGTRGWLAKLRGRDQIALDFQGLIKSAGIAMLSRAKRRIGFSRANLREPAASRFYTDRFEEIPETGHVIQKNLRLLETLGIREGTFAFPLAVPESLGTAVCNKISALGSLETRRLVLLNIGAAWPTKRWAPENWISVLNGLDHHIIHPILLWGTPVERALAEQIRQKTDVEMAPFLSIQESMALLKKAALLVSGDTFALQAACALGIPVVGIFGPTNPQRNGPFSPGDEVAYHEISCSLCYRRSCDSEKCLKLVTPSEVRDLIRKVLKTHA